MSLPTQAIQYDSILYNSAYIFLYINNKSNDIPQTDGYFHTANWLCASYPATQSTASEKGQTTETMLLAASTKVYQENSWMFKWVKHCIYLWSGTVLGQMSWSLAVPTRNTFVSSVVPHAAVPHTPIVGDLCLVKQREKCIYHLRFCALGTGNYKGHCWQWSSRNLMFPLYNLHIQVWNG